MTRLSTLFLALVMTVPLAAQLPPIPRPAPGALPPRDAVGPVPSGTGRIRGRIVQSGTTTPLRRATVILAGDQNLRRIVTTDADGRYEISELPAGRFTLTVEKGGFVSTQYGQRRSYEPGRPVVLAAGQTLAQVDVGLPRGAVIIGRLLDRSGEPAVGATISVERYQYSTDGQRRLTRVPLPYAVATDDRGAFRTFGLAPGEYLVSANVQQLPQLPGAGGGGAPVVANVQTYFPGTPSAAEAQGIVLEAGEEASAQFSLVAGRLATVSGTILDSSGRPAVGAGLALATTSASGNTSSRGSGNAGADGTFTITRVPPGEHFVQVRLNPRPGGVTEPEVANVPVSASGANIEGLQIMTAAAVVASGRVEWEGEAPRTGAPTALRLTATPADGRPGLLGLIGAADPNATGGVAADGSFRIGGLSGTVRFAPTGVPPRWALKAIFAGREDVTDASVEAASLAGVPLRVVLTDKTTEVTGAVRDANGAPVAEFVVVVLPEQPLDAAVATRYTRAIRADQKGTFQIRGLPAGRYIVTAVPGLEPGSEWDPAFQASVRNSARRFILEDGQSLTLTVDLLQ
jgi:hypothetical protein